MATKTLNNISLFAFFSLLLITAFPEVASCAEKKQEKLLKFFENEDTSSENKIWEKEEIHLHDEALFRGTSSIEGVKGDYLYTGNDRSKYALLGHLNGQSLAPFDLINAEVNYAKRLGIFWAEFMASYTKTTFGVISRNRDNTSGTNTGSENNFDRPDTTSETITRFGAGVSYRFKLPFFRNKKLFQTISAIGTYNILNESFRSETYTGPGMIAEFGVHWRASDHLFYGLRYNFNYAFVQRASDEENETANDRRLILAWTSLGIILGVYY